ncbi:MAG: isopeptide-forming domain-containing fimbrial protein [Candidatus Saccharibacteria bacterium]|nr:isopeptide-forming domain-containing fimbrial protein [Candidatus Saccharibacteria bacterium]
MKKLQTRAFLVATAVTVAAPIIGSVNASAAASVSYQDFSALDKSTLNGAYSHARIYYRDDTVITVVKGAGDATTGASTTTTGDAMGIGNIKAGETLSVLIENSTATDSAGNDVDVIYRVSDVNPWNEGEGQSYVGLSLQRSVYGSSDELHPANSDEFTKTTTKAGDPIVFWNNTRYADSLFTVQFCKKGTYNTTSDSCTPAGVNNLSIALWDFDVPNNTREKNEDGSWKEENGSYVYTKYGDQLMHGNEGIIPQNGNVTIYQNKNNPVADVAMSNEQNGFSAYNISNGATFDGIWFGNSIMATATGINSTWSYRYSGTACGAGFIFGSAVPYVMSQPQKVVDKDSAKVGDQVTYTISQEVPNNYSSESDMVAFMSLWSKYDSIQQNKGYASFAITDTFQDGIELPAANQITIKNEKGVNVTDQFTILIDGQKFTATSKDATFLGLYGHTYRITIPTTVTKDVEISPVENTAKTTFTPAGSTTPEDLSSNTVETEIIRKVITKHVDDKTGKEIADSSSEDYPQGADYTTNPLGKIPKGYELVKNPANAKGTIGNKDIEVIYRYRKITNPKTFDASTSAFIGVIVAGLAGSGLFFGIKRRR